MTEPVEKRARRVFVETYGCQMNVADTELMLGGLRESGYEVADRLDDADVILLNTCAVREKAEDRIYGRAAQLLRFKYTRPDLVLGITGCMAEHLKEKIVEKAPYVDLVIGPDAYRRLPELLDRTIDGEGDPIVDVRLDKGETYEGMTPARTPGVSGWITIQRGCDKFCTFCIVPYTRGRERGTPPREVLRQARELAAMGYREVTLLGQTVNSYVYEDVDFADLLRAVAEIDGIDRIRFTSPYPVDFTPKLIATIAELDKVPKYLHLPVQSGSDDVLERMKRGYTVAEFKRLAADLRAAIPGIALSTDVIVGFPGETDADFEATYQLVDELKFDFAYTFAYSEREGTYAAKRIEDDIPDAVKKERLARLIALQESIGHHKYRNLIGKTVKVLAEGLSRKGEAWYGKSADFKTTMFAPTPGLRSGTIVDVRVVDATAHTLHGEIVAPA
jgi:tRNA-2-methylthio-N6-dimethylallyladenosine synthase